MRVAGTADGTLPHAFASDFGDEGAGSGPGPTHVYAVAGNYSVTMTATNHCGQAAAQHSLLVLPPYRIYLPLVLRGSGP